MTAPRIAGRCALVVGALFAPAFLRAQTVRGSVVDANDQPVAGVVVSLIDSTARLVARSMSDVQGSFYVAAPHAGTYRLRTLRIGYRPVTTDPIELASSQNISRRLVLPSVALVLDSVRSSEQNPCRMVSGDSVSAVSLLWEQVRGAMAGAQLSAGSRTLSATTASYEREFGSDFRHVKRDVTSTGTALVKQPWRTAPADSLRRYGYVTIDARPSNGASGDLIAGVTIYSAPGLDMLTSEGFMEDHCLHMTGLSDSARLGIGFEPTPGRRMIPEISGTLWLDRKTSELRSMEFRFVHLVPEMKMEHAGGDMEFARLRNGAWIISAWQVRMPQIEAMPPGPWTPKQKTEVVAIQVIGGEVSTVTLAATRGRDTLWTRTPARKP